MFSIHRVFCANDLRRLTYIWTVCVLALVLLPTPASAQTIVQNDFENGTTQGWVPRGAAVLTNSTAQAHGGTHSLLTTGRTAGFNGPSLVLTSTLTPGPTYQITGWVRLVA